MKMPRLYTAVLLTSPTVASVGLSMQIPMAAAVEAGAIIHSLILIST